jgi:hypothetical protein
LYFLLIAGEHELINLQMHGGGVKVMMVVMIVKIFGREMCVVAVRAGIGRVKARVLVFCELGGLWLGL